jgi:hypothetical protein
MQTTKSNQTAQAETPSDYDRLLQLLCIIAQSLRRIELQLGKLAPVNQRLNESNKVINFNAGSGGRR